MIDFDHIEHCVCVPDGDPKLEGAPLGMVKVTDGIMYIAESDWLTFLKLLGHKLGMKGIEEKLRSAMQ